MFQSLNEFKYTTKSDKTYLVYFLKFWPAIDKKGDYIIKYQIRAQDKDFFWYGRISKERALLDLKIGEKEIKSIEKKELEDRIRDHLKKLLVAVIKRGLDKGFEEPDSEFIFYRRPEISKRTWGINFT